MNYNIYNLINNNDVVFDIYIYTYADNGKTIENST